MTELHEASPRQIDEAIVSTMKFIGDLEYHVNRAIQSLTYGSHNTLTRVRWWEGTDFYARRKDEFIVLTTDAEASAISVTSPRTGRTSTGWEDYASKRLHDECYEVLKPKALSQADIYAHCQDHGTEKHREVVTLIDDLKMYEDLLASYNEEYARRRWSRYWLVTSSVGHIHSSTGCSTCNKGRYPTSFALVTHLSGEEVDKAVDVFGPALCSVCFPSAPLEWTDATKIKSALTKAYEQGGYEAFLIAKAQAEAKAQAKASK